MDYNQLSLVEEHFRSNDFNTDTKFTHHIKIKNNIGPCNYKKKQHTNKMNKSHQTPNDFNI